MTLAFQPVGNAELSRKLKLVSRCELFRDLDDRALRDLASASVLSLVRRGDLLLTPGQPAEALYVLAEGRVTLFRDTEAGRRVILAIIYPGGVFNETSLVCSNAQERFAEATDASTVCRVPRAAIEYILSDRPETRIRLIEMVAQRLVELELRLTEVAYLSVPARVAATLLRLSDKGTHPISLRHSDIAGIVCTYRETATKALNEMRAARLIELERCLITVLDPERLAAMAWGGKTSCGPFVLALKTAEDLVPDDFG